jgi:Lhr-like helicase
VSAPTVADPLALFSEPVAAWFRHTFGTPTPPQAQGWPSIARGENALILSPTGSGKTLTAFLWSLDRLQKEEAVQRLIGLPREDWIKQVVQNNRVYSVWIYPKADAGAAAIYFDNGVVYHTNWNAAAPPAASRQ